MNREDFAKKIDKKLVIELLNGWMYYGKIIGTNTTTVQMEVMDEFSDASSRSFEFGSIKRISPIKNVSFIPTQFTNMNTNSIIIQQHLSIVKQAPEFLVATKKLMPHNGKDKKREWPTRYGFFVHAIDWLAEGHQSVITHPCVLVVIKKEEYLLGINFDRKVHKIFKDGQTVLLKP